MVRKRKSAQKEKDVIFCFYCDRVFSDETTLILHQKGKHWRCSECNKKLHSSSGMAIHMYQVHKIDVKTVPNAKPDRESMDWEIFGMAGVPEGMAPGGPVPNDGPDAKVQRVGDTPLAPGMNPVGGPGGMPGHYPHIQGPPQHAPPPYMMHPHMGYGMPPPGYMPPQTPFGFRPPTMPPSSFLQHHPGTMPPQGSQAPRHPAQQPPTSLQPPPPQALQPPASNGDGPLFPIASSEQPPPGAHSGLPQQQQHSGHHPQQQPSGPPQQQPGGVPHQPQQPSPASLTAQPAHQQQTDALLQQRGAPPQQVQVPPQAPPPAGPDMQLVWPHEQYCMEESRAQHLLSQKQREPVLGSGPPVQQSRG